ncbi:MAG: LysM peptidoglycan-binding domain-containing protein [Chloroflexota bacterium]
MNKIRLAAFFLGLVLIGVSILGFAAVQIGAASGSQLVYVAPSMTATTVGIEETTQAVNATTIAMTATAQAAGGSALGTSVAMTATAEAGAGGGGATATNTPLPTNTPAPTNTATPTRVGIGEATGTPALAPSPTKSPTPLLPDTGGGGPNSLGLHTVQNGETLYCLGRAYGVPPQAIAEFNELAPDAKLLIGQELKIPAVQWLTVPPGPICTPQLESPYSSVPARTLTPTPIPFLAFSLAHPENLSGQQLINFVPPRRRTAKTDSASTSFAVKSTPFPIVETRAVAVNWPSKMLLGASSDVVLTFNPDTGQAAVSTVASPGTVTNINTNTPEPNRSIVYSKPLGIPDLFDDYSVFAVARIDAVGLSSSPSGEVAYPLRLGESLTWRWSIKPLEAEQQKLIVSLQLRFTPKNPDGATLEDIQLWSDAFVMNVGKTVFGLTATQTTTAAGITGTVGFVSAVFGLWEKIEARLPRKQTTVSGKPTKGKKLRK